MTSPAVKSRRSRAFWVIAAMWIGAVLFALAQNLIA